MQLLKQDEPLERKYQPLFFQLYTLVKYKCYLKLETMDKLTAPGMAERRSEPAPATPVNTSAYTGLDTLISPNNHLLDSDFSIHSYNELQTTSMADRFPSLEDFSEGKSNPLTSPYSGANLSRRPDRSGRCPHCHR
jgi:hypothetical protein